MPEWYLALTALAVLSLVGVFERPLVPWTAGSPVPVELMLLALAGAALAVSAVLSGLRAPRAGMSGLALKSVTALLFLLQPTARLGGRLRYGLTPWRRRGEARFALPWPREREVWSERWRSPDERLIELERDLRTRCMAVRPGGQFDRWDLQVRLGPLAAARLRMAVEEHGHGRQLVRFRIWPRWSRGLAPLAVLLALWLSASAVSRPYLAGGLGALLLLVLLRALRDAGAGMAVVGSAVERDEAEESELPELLDDLRITSIRTPLLPRPPTREATEALEPRG